VSFYTQLFGWEAQRTWRRDSLDEYFIFRLRGRDVAGVGTQPREVAPALPAWGTYIWVENADETPNKVRAAGGRILMEPFDSVDHGRTAVVADPAGAAFSLWQPGARKGAQLVNEPGAWSMSQLNTNDPDTARFMRRYSAGRSRSSTLPAPS
jgi:uncharacterized protein